MNEQLARTLFMDYLYGEIKEEDKQHLESFLKDHPKLKTELNELRQTHALLQQMPETYPARKLAIVEPHKRTMSEWWNNAKDLLPSTLLGKTCFAAAAALALLLIVGSATKMNISYSEQGFSLSLGAAPTVAKGLSQQQAQALVHQIHQENTMMLSDYADAINQQNKQQLQQVVQYFEQQRTQDLHLIGQSMGQLQKSTNNRWLQTNQFLGQVLQNVSLKDQK